MIRLTDEICLDPRKARFDLTLEEAFRLTEVRSIEDFERLKKRLPEIRGHYYFFINLLSGRRTLMVTVIMAEKDTVTDTFPLDPEFMGISSQEIAWAHIDASDGNYPLPLEIEEKVKVALNNGC